MKLNLIMPMGGGGTRFGNKGFDVPKPLIEIYGRPFFYWATESIRRFVEIASLSFVVLQDHINRFQIDAKIKAYYPKATIIIIPEVLNGAVLTCLAGCKHLDSESAILFNDCDHLFLCSRFNEFCVNSSIPKSSDSNILLEDIDGGLLTFKSSLDKFSYVAYDKEGYVSKTVEKEVISNDAICGAYYFKNKLIFQEAAKVYLDNCQYQEFFVSGVYNVMASLGQKIKSFSVDKHVSFGTPEEYDEAINDTTYEELM